MNMASIQKGIDKISKFSNPLILLLFPLVHVQRGVDLTDTTYNLGNYRFFAQYGDSTWNMATYASSLFGSLLMHLPGGDTMLGMNVYSSLLLSMMALLAYYALLRLYPSKEVFVGVLIATGLSWCPYVNYYNYLTYFLLMLAVLFLYKGLTKNLPWLLFAAGFCLGLNILVRFPNITQAALILAVWYYLYRMAQQKKHPPLHIIRPNEQDIRKMPRPPLQNFWTVTGMCLFGYLVGFASLYWHIVLRFGWSAYPQAILRLLQSGGETTDYTIFAMFRSIFSAYATNLKWLLVFLSAIAGGLIMFSLARKKYIRTKKFLYIIVLMVLIRFVWGRGMFGFDYSEYFAMISWATLFLLITLFTLLWVLTSRVTEDSLKVMAMLLLVVIFVTPLGSNNNIYPVINNLYLVAPFTIVVLQKYLMKAAAETGKRYKMSLFPLKATLYVIFLMVLLQSFGFGLTFVFRGGQEQQKLDTQIATITVAKGMYTSAQRAEELEGLADFMDGEEYAHQRIILFGNIPGIAYLLDREPAISHTWPDLDSYGMEEFMAEIEGLEGEDVLLVVPAAIGEKLLQQDSSSTSDATLWERKLQYLKEYLQGYSYRPIYYNEEYYVFGQENL